MMMITVLIVIIIMNMGKKEGNPLLTFPFSKNSIMHLPNFIWSKFTNNDDADDINNTINNKNNNNNDNNNEDK